MRRLNGWVSYTDELNYIEPGTLYNLNGEAMFYQLKFGEFGNATIARHINDTCLMFLNDEKLNNNIFRLNFFNHQHGIISHNFFIYALASKNNKYNLFQNLTAII